MHCWGIFMNSCKFRFFISSSSGLPSNWFRLLISPLQRSERKIVLNGSCITFLHALLWIITRCMWTKLFYISSASLAQLPPSHSLSTHITCADAITIVLQTCVTVQTCGWWESAIFALNISSRLIPLQIVCGCVDRESNEAGWTENLFECTLSENDLHLMHWFWSGKFKFSVLI